MATRQEMQNLVQEIQTKQEQLKSNMKVMLTSNKYKTANKRARLLSIELEKLYKQYRKGTVHIEE